jgi:hypothetical protein
MFVSRCQTLEYAHPLRTGRKVLSRDVHLYNDMADPMSCVERELTFYRGKQIHVSCLHYFLRK